MTRSPNRLVGVVFGAVYVLIGAVKGYNASARANELELRLHKVHTELLALQRRVRELEPEATEEASVPRPDSAPATPSPTFAQPAAPEVEPVQAMPMPPPLP